VQIKAQGLLNAAKFIETQYGRDALGEVVRACSEPVRDRYISAIAINWHPIEEFLEFVQTADKILGDGKGKLIEEIGAAGARANLKGMAVRIAFYMAQPDFFFRRVAGLWHQFNDEGEMLTHAIAERSGAVEVAGISKPNAIFCGVLTGWIREVSTALGIQDPSPRHTECRARGDARCYWEIRWTALQPDQQGEREARESIDRLQTKASSVRPGAPSSIAPTAPSSGAVRASPPSSAGRITPPGPARTSSQSALKSVSASPSKDPKKG
jgi:hypothetical protein